MLCAVQGRQTDCTDRYLYDYPTVTSNAQKDLGESGNTEDTADTEDPFNVRSIAIQGHPSAQVPPGTYTVLVEVEGQPDSLLIELYNSVDDSLVGGWGGSQMGDGTNPQTFTFANQDFTTNGDFYIQASATKGADQVALQLNVNVDTANNPDDAVNLIPGGFELFDPTDDSSLGFIRTDPQTEVEIGTYEIRGLIIGGTPAEVEMTISGPGVNRTVTDSTAPYTFWGDDTDPYVGTALAAGTYTMTLTAIDGEGDRGITSDPLTLVVTPPPDPIFVTGFQWANVDGASSNLEGALNEGDTIQVLNDVGFVAQTSGPVGSVKFSLMQNSSEVHNGIDTTAPYTIYGDSGGNYAGRTLAPGNYRLTATAYRTADQTGEPSAAYRVNFTIEGEGPQALQVFLIDADTNQRLGQVTPGMRLSKWTNISFEAITNDDTLSTEIIITGRAGTSYNNSQEEGVKPFSAFGDSSGNFAGRSFSDGQYRITIVPHDVDKNSQSSASAGTSLGIDFTVSAGACPVYETFQKQGGCQGNDVQLTLTTSCGPNTEVTIGAPLNAGAGEWSAVQDWAANELEQTWNHGWYLNEGDGYEAASLDSVCSGATPLDIRVVYGDGTVERYEFRGDTGTISRK